MLFGGTQGQVKYTLILDDQASAKLGTFNTKLSGLGTAAGTANTNMGALNHNFAGVNGGLTQTNTLIGAGSGNTGLLARMKSFGTVMSNNALSFSLAAGGILGIWSSVSGLAKAQLALDRANTKVDTTAMAAKKALDEYNKVVAAFGKDSPKAKLAAEKLAVANDKHAQAVANAAIKQDNFNQVMGDFVTNIVPNLIFAAGGISDLAGKLNKGNIGSSLGKIKTALTGLPALLTGLSTGMAGLATALGPLVVAAVFGAAIIEKAAGAFDHLSKALSTTDQATKLNEVSAAMKSFKTSDFNSWSDFITMFTTSSGPLDTWTGAIDNLVQAMKNGTLQNDPIFQFSKALEAVINAMAKFSGITIPAAWNAFVTSFTDATVATWNALSGAFTSVSTALGTLFGNTLPTWWTNFINNPTKGVIDAWNSFSTAIGTLATNLGTLFSKTMPTWWTGFVAGVNTTVTAAWNSFSGSIKAVSDALGTLFGQTLPSWWDTVVKFFSGGGFQGAEAAGPGGGVGKGLINFPSIPGLTPGLSSKGTGGIGGASSAIQLDNKGALKAVDAVAKRITGLSSIQADISLQNKVAIKIVDVVAKRIDSLTSIKPQISLQNKQAIKAVDVVAKRIDSLEKLKPQISLDNKKAIKAVDVVANRINSLSSIHPTINATVKVGVSGAGARFVKAQQGMHETLTQDTTILAHKGERVDIGHLERARSDGGMKSSGGFTGNIIVETYIMNEKVVRKAKAEMGRNRFTFG